MEPAAAAAAPAAARPRPEGRRAALVLKVVFSLFIPIFPKIGQNLVKQPGQQILSTNTVNKSGQKIWSKKFFFRREKLVCKKKSHEIFFKLFFLGEKKIFFDRIFFSHLEHALYFRLHLRTPSGGVSP